MAGDMFNNWTSEFMAGDMFNNWTSEFGDNIRDAYSDMAQMKEDMKSVKDNMDIFFRITVGLVIYFMQCGFAFLEAGAVRSKNTVNILIKNLLDTFIAGKCYWLVGYAFAYGDSAGGFIGKSNFALSIVSEVDYSHWFFQFVFTATCATIVSGAVAERCNFNAYLVYSYFLTGFIYPVISHWGWSENGWLKVGANYIDANGDEFNIGYHDFAGSGVVHTCGGVTAFIGALMLGPRIGRFDENGEPQDIKGHSVPLAALGGFILLFGFFAFNGGSQGQISAPGDGAIVSQAICNTVLAASGGGAVTLVLYFCIDKRWSLLTCLNGCLAGMVSACAGCDVMYSWSGFTIGVIGGLMNMLVSWVVLRLKVDDPLDATAVHLGGGFVGLFFTPIFDCTNGLVHNASWKTGLMLGWNMAGFCAIAAWSVLFGVLIFGGMKLLGWLRVSEEVELNGLDIRKHENAYPEEAYGHGWGDGTGKSIDAVTLQISGHGNSNVRHRTNLPVKMASKDPSHASLNSSDSGIDGNTKL